MYKINIYQNFQTVNMINRRWSEMLRKYNDQMAKNKMYKKRILFTVIYQLPFFEIKNILQKFRKYLITQLI